MTVLVDGKYYEDATYNTQFISVMNGEAVPVPDEVPDPEVADNGKVLTVVEGVAVWADAPVELPVSEEADNGKVLTVVEGVAAWADAPVELPVSEVADNGKVLTVVGGEAAWADAPVELPVSGVADDGKVLTVDETGAPAWQAPTHPAQFVIGADAPTDTAVLWVDTAGANPVLKVYITDA